MTSVFRSSRSRSSLGLSSTSKQKTAQNALCETVDKTPNSRPGRGLAKAGSADEDDTETPSQSQLSLFTVGLSKKQRSAKSLRKTSRSPTGVRKPLSPKQSTSGLTDSLWLSRPKGSTLPHLRDLRDFETDFDTPITPSVSNPMAQATEESPEPVFKASHEDQLSLSPSPVRNEDASDAETLDENEQMTLNLDDILPACDQATRDESPVDAGLHDDDDYDAASAAQLLGEGSRRLRLPERSDLATADDTSELDKEPEYSFHSIRSHRPLKDDPNKFELEIVWAAGDPKSSRTWAQEEDIMLDAPNAYFKYWKNIGGREIYVEDPDLWYMFKIKRERKSGRGRAYLIQWLGSTEESWEPETNVRRVAKELLEEWKAEKGEDEEAEPARKRGVASTARKPRTSKKRI
ncbi:hypothetical protein BROUX41_004327 [Berkeleyomyces rouxiae]